MDNRLSMPNGNDSQKILLQTLLGKKTDQTPVWLMRQAGRYLPEYRELRAKKGGFLELCYDAEAAAEVTLQPIKRFGFDGAILFSDILIVPHAMGQRLWFETGEGPRLAPRLVDAALSSLEAAPEHFEAIYATVRRVAERLDDKTTFMGFAGSPWTVATYMVHGQGSKDQGVTRRYAYKDEATFSELINAIIGNTVEYLLGQIEAGVDAVQLFDSWAGSLSPAQFEKWVIAPNAEIISRLKAVHPDTKPTDLARPGHTFPLRAKNGGVLVRIGQTEASVDMARLAGLDASATICEVMSEDGSMARLPELEVFAENHDMKIISVADLVRYRIEKESLVKKIIETDLPTEYGTFKASVYENIMNGETHVAMTMGDVSGEDESVLVRVQTENITFAMFGSKLGEASKAMQSSLKKISEAGKV